MILKKIGVLPFSFLKNLTFSGYINWWFWIGGMEFGGVKPSCLVGL